MSVCVANRLSAAAPSGLGGTPLSPVLSSNAIIQALGYVPSSNVIVSGSASNLLAGTNITINFVGGSNQINFQGPVTNVTLDSSVAFKNFTVPDWRAFWTDTHWFLTNVDNQGILDFSASGLLTTSAGFKGDGSLLTNANATLLFGSGNVPSTYLGTNSGTDGQILSKTGDFTKWIDQSSAISGVHTQGFIPTAVFQGSVFVTNAGHVFGIEEGGTAGGTGFTIGVPSAFTVFGALGGPGMSITANNGNNVQNNEGLIASFEGTNGIRFCMNLQYSIKTITANYTNNVTNSVIFVDTSLISITNYLPASPRDGMVYTIKKVINNGNFVSVVAIGKNIEGGPGLVSSSIYAGWTVIYSAAAGQWLIYP